MSDLEFCNKLTTIYQNTTTCWFNAILMSVFYSQNSRKLLLKEYKNWDPNNKFLLICKDILLKYYIFSNDSVLFFNKFKPEVIIFYMLKFFNDNILKNTLKLKIKTLGGYYNFAYYVDYYINNIYKYLGIKYLDITYLKDSNKYLLNFHKYIKFNDNLLFDLDVNFNNSIIEEKKEIKKILDNIPDLLIFYHSDISISYTNHVKQIDDLFIQNNNKLEKIYDSTTYSISIDGLLEFKDIIYFNGHSYKLESSLFYSFNNTEQILEMNHVITGLTCKNNKYIFDSYANLKSCPLIKFDWNLNNYNHFCMNYHNCTTEYIEKNTNCYSLHNGKNITLIYIRNDNPNIINSIDINNPFDDIIPDVSLKPDFNSIIKNIHDIKKLSKDEIILQLKYFNAFFDADEKKSRKELQKSLYSALSNYYKHHIPESYNSKYSSDYLNDIESIDPDYFHKIFTADNTNDINLNIENNNDEKKNENKNEDDENDEEDDDDDDDDDDEEDDDDENDEEDDENDEEDDDDEEDEEDEEDEDDNEDDEKDEEINSFSSEDEYIIKNKEIKKRNRSKSINLSKEKEKKKKKN